MNLFVTSDTRFAIFETTLVFFDRYGNFGSQNPECYRVKVGENRPEDLFSLSSLRRYFGIFGIVGRPGAGRLVAFCARHEHSG